MTGAAGIHGISAVFLGFRQAEFSTFVERHVESVLYFLWKRVVQRGKLRCIRR